MYEIICSPVLMSLFASAFCFSFLVSLYSFIPIFIYFGIYLPTYLLICICFFFPFCSSFFIYWYLFLFISVFPCSSSFLFPFLFALSSFLSFFPFAFLYFITSVSFPLSFITQCHCLTSTYRYPYYYATNALTAGRSHEAKRNGACSVRSNTKAIQGFLRQTNGRDDPFGPSQLQSHFHQFFTAFPLLLLLLIHEY